MANTSLNGTATSATKKNWGVLAYIVAEPPPGSSQNLDSPARKEVQAIVKAADSVQPLMHVAYQVDYGDKVGIFRRIVDDSTPDEEKVNEPSDSEAGDPVVLTNFFKWALENCEADRYAVFFWGHSFGPASMFAPPLPGLRVLGLPELRKALDSFKDDGKNLNVVLFKDCWMSTLETACELKGVAAFVVASQALVPVGSVWPYQELFEGLASGKSATESGLVTQLGQFYDKPENRGLDAAVPFALLDLTHINRVSDAISELVNALRKTSSDGSRMAIEQASIAEIALVDVRTMCANLQRPSLKAAADAARALDSAVKNLVVEQYAQTPGYQGVSVFYYPSQDRRNSNPGARYIWPLLPFSRYAEFEIAKTTKWTDVAFEQLQPSQSSTQKELAMPNPSKPENFDGGGDEKPMGLGGLALEAHAAFVDAIRKRTGNPTLSQLIAASSADYSGALTAAMTALMTNIQSLDKSVALLAQTMNQAKENMSSLPPSGAVVDTMHATHKRK